jgi:hypothetical protein
MREGNHTAKDIETLENRKISPDMANYPMSAQHLFKTNSQVDQFNVNIYDMCTRPKLVVSQLILSLDRYRTLWQNTYFV